MLWIIVILLALILAALIFGGPAVAAALGVVGTVIAGIVFLAMMSQLDGQDFLLLGFIAALIFVVAVMLKSATAGKPTSCAPVAPEAPATDPAPRPARAPDREEQIQILVRERQRMRAAGDEATPRFKAIEDQLARLGWK